MTRFSVVLLVAALAGCLARPVITRPETDAHDRQTEQIKTAVLAVAKTGDWLVTRGYHATDNLVSNATGVPISHAAVFNRERRQLVEAEGKGVHLSGLQAFIDKSYRVLVIRPRWRTAGNGDAAWQNAEALVGRGYDFLGTIGFSYPDRYYCSELTVTIYEPWYTGRERFPAVIKPGELYLFGEILYDSLPRDEWED